MPNVLTTDKRTAAFFQIGSKIKSLHDYTVLYGFRANFTKGGHFSMTHLILDRILSEIKEAEGAGATTMHNVYTSGLIEDNDQPQNEVLSRVLSEIKEAEASGMTTMHNVYTSGLIEDNQ